MKNYLIITIGTRDVQLRKDLIMQADEWTVQTIKDEKTGRDRITVRKAENQLDVSWSKDFPDYYTVTPRIGGKILADITLAFADILEMPLITPVVDQLAQEEKTVDVVLLIYTNQEQEYSEGKVKPFHYNNDTLFFASVVETLLRRHPLLQMATFDQYEIYERVADIDYQYDQFAAKNHSLFDDSDEVESIFLLPQGGIDQINQAVTLQLIQAFKHRVKLYQKPDGADPVVLTFTDRFLDDLNKQKIHKHLDDYDFDAITEDLHSNTGIFERANYAALRLNLQYNSLQQEISEKEKVADLYLAMKIRFLKQRKYNEFLWRAHTLNEVLFKIPVENIVGSLGQYFSSAFGKNDINEPFEQKLKQIHPDLIAYLKKKNVAVNNPNRWAYKSTYIFLCNNGIFVDPQMGLRKRVGDKLELFAKKRNDAQHGLGSITSDEIDEILGGQKQDYRSGQLFADLDQIFNISGFGIYDTIATEIRNLLD
ncbi:hypothetical protein [Rudanella lutea]|uniref:hypothetical protein n=1 Tax=Rudanella lutea TaxID=451374 RepID=UPI00037940DE|nr:hypothetical protein [Rudanella lutea]